MTQQEYWFKRRRYGYGWTPATREGWLCFGAVLVVVVGGAIILGASRAKTAGPLIGYLVAVAAALAALAVLTIFKAPKARWRWGARPGDNPAEDL